MSNSNYDALKMVALLIAPFTVFVASVMDIWEIPYTSEVTATLAAIDTLLGATVATLSKFHDSTPGRHRK